MRSSSRTLAVVSPSVRPREITRSSFESRIRALASRPRTCRASLTDFGKRRPARTVKAPGSAFQSPRASSRPTADESGSRARRLGARPSPLRFPRRPPSRVDRRHPAGPPFSKVAEPLRCQRWTLPHTRRPPSSFLWCLRRALVSVDDLAAGRKPHLVPLLHVGECAFEIFDPQRLTSDHRMQRNAHHSGLLRAVGV